MLQRNSSPLRVSVLVLTVAVALFGVIPNHATAQAAQAEMPTPAFAPAAPTPPAPPAPPPPQVPPVPAPAIPPAPPEPPTPSHPVSRDVGTHGGSGQVHLLDDNTANVSGDAEDARATKSQRLGREQKMIGSKQRKRDYQQWDRSERLRVANEAARREAERMINAASPMDWRNRYSSD